MLTRRNELVRARRAGVALIVAFGLIPWLLATPAGVVAQEESVCGDPATLIHEIQGTDSRTGVGGQTFTIEGVVVGDYQDTISEFSGFFVQEEDADADDDPLTSEGIFVDSKLVNVDVAPGDVVRVTGAAFELSDSGASLTQLRRVKSIAICSSGASVTPTPVTLPVEDVSGWERYEGMLVTFPQTLTATEIYNLGRYGEVMLSVDGRLYEPTNVARPGAEAAQVQAENDRRLIILDDGNSLQNVDPTAYPAGGLSASNILRTGYMVTGLTGVLDQRVGTYRVHATEAPVFVPGNLRPETPPDVGGRLTVAAFNVLNYFNGDGQGSGFPTPRGANTPEEFTRQRDKIIHALLVLDADVIGLMEIENDGSGPDSAVADLVNGLNAAAGEGVYAYIADPDDQLLPSEGADEIKQAIIYRPASVTPVGDPVATLDPPFDQRRPPVAQAFEENASGERFIVVANHFKSKGCTGAGVDPDIGDGQGCWNQERVQAAHTLVDWLAADPTGTGDTDVLLIGDFNSYALEDPMIVFRDAGYESAVRVFGGEEDDYSYVYFGQAGSMDHALMSTSIASQVTGAAHWHINADEPIVFDYNVEYKTDNHIVSLYDDGPFRSSDHDPVVVGLALAGDGGEVTEPADGEPTGEPADAEDETPAPVTEPADEEPTEETGDVEDETPAPEVQPADEETDLSDDSGGTVAVIVGIIVMVAAALGGWLLQRGRRARSR
jgi:predicted extracellular nuclease